MTFHSATIELPTTKKSEMIDVTKRVRAVAAASNVQSGICTVFCGHTTGAVIVLAEEYAGAVGKRRRCGRQQCPQPLELAELRPVGGMIRFVGAGEMAHDQPDLDAIEGVGRSRKPLDVGGRHADARHAAVDLQRRR